MHGSRRRTRRRGRMKRSERRRELKRQETTTACGPSTHRISIRHYSLSSILCHCHIQSFHSFYHLDMTNCNIFLFYNFLVTQEYYIQHTRQFDHNIFCTNDMYQVNSNLIKNVFFFILILLINTKCIAGCFNFELFCFFSHLSFYTCNNKNFLIKVQQPLSNY